MNLRTVTLTFDPILIAIAIAILIVTKAHLPHVRQRFGQSYIRLSDQYCAGLHHEGADWSRGRVLAMSIAINIKMTMKVKVLG